MALLRSLLNGVQALKPLPPVVNVLKDFQPQNARQQQAFNQAQPFIQGANQQSQQAQPFTFLKSVPLNAFSTVSSVYGGIKPIQAPKIDYAPIENTAKRFISGGIPAILSNSPIPDTFGQAFQQGIQDRIAPSYNNRELTRLSAGDLAYKDTMQPLTYDEKLNRIANFALAGTVDSGANISRALLKQIEQRHGADIARIVADSADTGLAKQVLKATGNKASQLLKGFASQSGVSAAIGNTATTAAMYADPNKLTSAMPSTGTTVDYLKQLAGAQRSARKIESPTLLDRGKSFIADVKRKLVDSASPIEDILYRAKKEGAVIKPSEDITNQIDRVLRTRTLAAKFAEDNGLVDVIRRVPDVQTLDQYLIALHAPEVSNAGFVTGRNATKDAQLVQDLGPVYQPYADQVIGYGQKLLDYSTESGLISNETNAALKAKYPNYVPLNRIFTEMEKSTISSATGTSGIASLSRQTVVQGLKGSERAIQNPTESLLTKTLDAFNQGERNLAGQQLASYKDLPGNPFNITPLRTAENVKQRIDLFSQAKELKPVQNKIERLLATRNNWARKLKSAINQLNKEGLHLSLQSPVIDEAIPKQPVSQLEIKKYIKSGTADYSTGGSFGVPFVDKVKLRIVPGELSNRETKSLVNSLVNLPRSEIESVKSKIATRENRLGGVLDTMANLSDHLSFVKNARGGLLDEAALLKDAESRGKSIFTTLKDGIKEVYETTPEIANAAKLLDKQQLGIIGKIFAFPVRIARIGITGVNPSFIVSNLAKDQVSAAINSNKALQTSILNPKVFMQALWNAVGHGAEYDDWIRSAGGGTSFDISRNAPNQTVAIVRAGRNVKSQIAYTVTHPGQWLRTVENVVSRGEEMTRLQQFIGTKKSLIAGGMSEKEATIAAARQSREATVNFARSGDWGRALNSTFLYLNAGIQGSRTLVRNLETRPAATIAKIGITVFTPLASVVAWNLSDPQRKAAYDDIRDYEKDNNLILIPPNPTKDPKTGKWNVIKVPFSQEVANITVPFRKGMESLYGANPPGFTDVAKALIGSTTGINVQSPNQLIGQFTPQAVKPGLEMALNKNLFTGQDIVPQYISGKRSKDLPPEFQVRDDTSGTARILAKPFDTSPIKIEQLIRDTAGGVGSHALNAVDTGLAAAGVIPSNQVGGQSVPEAFSSRFSLATGGQQLSNKYDSTNPKNMDRNSEQYKIQFNTPFLMRQAIDQKYGNKIGPFFKNAIGSMTDKEYKRYEAAVANGADRKTILKDIYQAKISIDARRKISEIIKDDSSTSEEKQMAMQATRNQAILLINEIKSF